MATIDEIFATMTVDENTVATDEVLVIDPNTRQISIPGGELVFGVESDTGAERKYFMAPRYVGNNLDLASCFIRVNYRNANGEIDAYLVDDVAATEDAIQFSWELSRKVTQYMGQVQFVVCACRPTANGKMMNEWNTTLATGMVLAGLEPDSAVVEAETRDVIAQLLALVEAQSANVEAVGAEQVAKVTAEGTTQVANVKSAAQDAQADAVAQVEAKGASTLATIPEDYTTVQNAVRGTANAIRKKVSGEVIRVDDVSPMEHYPEIKVSNRNMCEITGEFVSTVGVGGYYTPKRLTYAAPHIENGKTYVFTAETDDELHNTVLSVVFYGLRASGATTLDSRSSPGVLRCVVTPSDFVRIDTVELRFNRIPSASATEERTIRYRNIYFGLTEYEGMEYSYVDPTTVTVRRYSKNLVPPHETNTQNGYTVTKNDDGSVMVTGASTTDGRIYLNLSSVTENHFLLHRGAKYSFKWASSNGRNGYMKLVGRDGSNQWITLTGDCTPLDSDLYAKVVQIYVQIGASSATDPNAIGDTSLCGTYYFQFEAGGTTSDFEAYRAPVSQIPSADGTVSGLSAVSPTMTLMTDTPGVNIECEYSRDTNVVVNEILEMISALTSGT